MVPPTPTSLALTLLLASPFQWFTVAAAKTFQIPKLNNAGATLGGIAFVLGTGVVLWQWLYTGFDLTLGALGEQYRDYELRVGFLLLLPGRR